MPFFIEYVKVFSPNLKEISITNNAPRILFDEELKDPRLKLNNLSLGQSILLLNLLGENESIGFVDKNV